MTESLDGGAVTYRSARHFDILNENIIFPFQAASTDGRLPRNFRFTPQRLRPGAGPAELHLARRGELRRSLPGTDPLRREQHDRRRADGLLRPGERHLQHLRLQPLRNEFRQVHPALQKSSTTSARSSATRPTGLQQLSPVYAAMGQARQFSSALRSSNRYYLNQTGGSVQPEDFLGREISIRTTLRPRTTDVVFGFMNLDRNNNQSGNFNVNITQNSSNLFGIKRGRNYDVQQHRRLHGRRSESAQLFPQSQNRRPTAQQRAFRRPEEGPGGGRRTGRPRLSKRNISSSTT